ncbi:MAG: hypothetical protein E7269_01450 [Lachnospiraceae bacterium]|nr:hypothetical protein [Lachnospiraceae bacterium]
MSWEEDYTLKYPVLMVHGMGFRDNKYINYWGRIPAELEKMGCTIFYGNQDSNATVETNGEHIKKRIEEILQETGADKVNIIAHSKGGLDSRYAISTLGMGDMVASLTTMSTPHHGSKTVDLLLKLPDFLVRFAGFCTDCCFRLVGDKNPESYKTFHLFTTKVAAEFNRKNPDVEKVYYQSYAFVMKNPFSDIFMWLPNLVVGLIEGENDGLLTPEAVKWTNFKGIYRGVGRRGISHCDEIDIRRRRFSKKNGDGVTDIVDVYKDVVHELHKRGF